MNPLLQLRPQLRSEIRFSIESYGSTPCCVLEDPISENFWRIGIPEFRFISQLDGIRSIPEALAAANRDADETPVSPSDAERILHWLVREDLLANARSGSPTQPKGSLAERTGSLIFLRWPLGNPQPLLEKLYPWLGFVTGPGFALIWAAVVLAALYLVVGNWNEFRDSSVSVISPDQWWHFVLIWWGLKAVHELFHGLTCLRYGGQVREAGILFILFAPLGAYVDVTSSWRFGSKWERIHVIVAGIYSEFLVAALAIIVWANTDDIVVKQICLQTALLATIATVLFNSNPLIRFDGYYLLSDWLEIPNLYQRGQLALRRLVGRIVFGASATEEHTSGRWQTFILGYGVAASIWKVLLCASILVACASLLHGAGLVLAILATIAWLVLPLCRGLMSIAQVCRTQPAKAVRAIVVATLLGGAAYFLLSVLIVPQYVIVPGVIRPTKMSIVRSNVAGQVIDVQVKPGQSVQEGDLLVRLESPELDLRVLQAQNELKRIEQRRRQLNREDRIAEELAEVEVARHQQQQLDILLNQQQSLEVRAPHDGIVTDFDLSHLSEQYIDRGTPLVNIAEVAQLEFWFSGRQNQIDLLRRYLRDKSTRRELHVEMFVDQHAPVGLNVEKLTLNESATRDLEEDALSALSGGSIAVSARQRTSGRTFYETVDSRISGKVPLEVNESLVPGSKGTLRITLQRRTVLQWLSPWLEEKWLRTRDQLQGVSNVSRN